VIAAQLEDVVADVRITEHVRDYGLQSL
jgi:hypothetical protein